MGLGVHLQEIFLPSILGPVGTAQGLEIYSGH